MKVLIVGSLGMLGALLWLVFYMTSQCAPRVGYISDPPLVAPGVGDVDGARFPVETEPDPVVTQIPYWPAGMPDPHDRTYVPRVVDVSQNEMGCVVIRFSHSVWPTLGEEHAQKHLLVGVVHPVVKDKKMPPLQLAPITRRWADKFYYMAPPSYEAPVEAPVTVTGFIFTGGVSLKNEYGRGAFYSFPPFLTTTPIPNLGGCRSPLHLPDGLAPVLR